VSAWASRPEAADIVLTGSALTSSSTLDERRMPSDDKASFSNAFE
jgi:hypothetical protein